jgi:hypothetical protein
MPERTESAPSALVVPNEEMIIKEARQRHRQRVLAIGGAIVLVMAGLVIAALAIAGQWPSGRQPSRVSTRPDWLPATTATKCQNGQLGVSSSGWRGTGMSHVIDTLVFTNGSKTACSVSGYPVVVALDAQGHNVATAESVSDGLLALPPGITAPPTVPVKPGQSVSATVEGGDNPVGMATSCTDYPSFLVTPPGQSQAAKVTLMVIDTTKHVAPFPGCWPIVVSPMVDGTYGVVSSGVPSRTSVRFFAGKPASTIPTSGISATEGTPISEPQLMRVVLGAASATPVRTRPAAGSRASCGGAHDCIHLAGRRA